MPNYRSSTGSCASRRCRACNGMTLIYASVLLVVMSAFASLGVDWGRTQAAKTEIRIAADAAARYGAQGLALGNASTNAIAVAAQNQVDGTPLVLLAADIQTGSWNSSTLKFTAGGTNPTAVRIAAQRSSARGTAIPLLFAKVIGTSNCD